jgi:hypothetical protein
LRETLCKALNTAEQIGMRPSLLAEHDCDPLRVGVGVSLQQRGKHGRSAYESQFFAPRSWSAPEVRQRGHRRSGGWCEKSFNYYSISVASP